ncbi:RNase P modulator RnpM [Metalysinibacillus jejuensis]|uniref:RNase P modulator RnpM n=1 Tax=Metalysinibacillus jejuensis TaxID=914327 RepID=UPI003D04541F
MLVSKQRKVPLRKCVVTGEMLPKKEMVRIVRSKEGEVSVDATGKKPGRGAYIRKTEEAVQLAKQKNTLGHQLGSKIPDEIYDEVVLLIRRESLL